MSQVTNWSEYWEGRWNRKEIGWHQAEPEEALVRFFQDLPPTRVFVPLCGKSKDMLWFAQRGYEVIGVELTELGCKEFFEENHLPFQKSSVDGLLVYAAPSITIFNADLFTIDPARLGLIDSIYDRAALIALPPDLRRRYSDYVSKVAERNASQALQFCQVVLERTPADDIGPPFSVSEKELRDLYGKRFEISLISRELEEQSETQKLEQCVYRLVPYKSVG